MWNRFVSIALAVTISLPIMSISARAFDSSSQYFTKLYTEALGRAPDFAAQEGNLAYFETNGCTSSTASVLAQAVLLSDEFRNDYSDYGSMIAGLYRAVLSREVDAGGFSNALAGLSSGQLTWPQIVNQVLASAEFFNLVTQVICVTPASSDGAGAYGWGGGDIFDRRTGNYPGTFTGTDGVELQNLLTATVSGETVYLDPGSVVQVNAPLVIPSGVTLTTYGHPGPLQYLLMARIVRSAAFADALIKVEPGAALENIWVEGNRANLDAAGASCMDPSTLVHPCYSVGIFGGDNTVVSNNRFSDSDGWTNLVAFGDYSGFPCGSSVALQIADNLSTQYGTSHVSTGQQAGLAWSDGLSIECEDANVVGNTVVDATDTGIVLFASASAQRTNIASNLVINNGNAAFGSIVADTRIVQAPIGNASFLCTSNDAHVYNFNAATIQSNEIYTSPNSYVGIGIALGTKSFFLSSCDGTGIALINNSTGGHIMVANDGIAVSGMNNAYVVGNGLNLSVGQHTACPVANAIANPLYSTGLVADIPFSWGVIRHCDPANNTMY